MLNDLATHRAAPLPTPPACYCSGHHPPVVLKPKRRGHDTANASIQTTTIMRETLLQELCPVLYWYWTGLTTAVYLQTKPAPGTGDGGRGEGKDQVFKRRSESSTGNMMVDVVKKQQRKVEKIRWWDQQFVEMVNGALGRGTEEITVSWQQCRETFSWTHSMQSYKVWAIRWIKKLQEIPNPQAPKVIWVLLWKSTLWSNHKLLNSLSQLPGLLLAWQEEGCAGAGVKDLQLLGCPRRCSAAGQEFGGHRSLIFRRAWGLLLADRAKLKWRNTFPWRNNRPTQHWELPCIIILELYITKVQHAVFFPSLPPWSQQDHMCQGFGSQPSALLKIGSVLKGRKPEQNSRLHSNNLHLSLCIWQDFVY